MENAQISIDAVLRLVNDTGIDIAKATTELHHNSHADLLDSVAGHFEAMANGLREGVAGNPTGLAGMSAAQAFGMFDRSLLEAARSYKSMAANQRAIAKSESELVAEMVRHQQPG